jgi:hypothetical protein
VLDCPGDSDGDVQERGDCLAGAADLAIHREPPGVADRSGRSNLGAECRGQCPHECELRLFLDAASHGNDTFGLCQVDRLPRLAEWCFRLLTHVGGSNGGRDNPNRGRRVAHRGLIGPERTDLECHEVGVRSFQGDLRGDLALKHWPCERRDAVVRFSANAIGGQRPVETSRQAWCEVTSLVCMRQQHVGGGSVAQETRKRGNHGVWRVLAQRLVFQSHDF